MQRNWMRHIMRGDSLQREIINGRMEGKRGRGRPRQTLLDWMMSEEYRKLKEEAQHRETWNHWRSEPARGQRTYRRSHRKFPKITTQQKWYRRRADKISAAARPTTKVGGGGGAHKLSAAAARHGRRTALVLASCTLGCDMQPMLDFKTASTIAA